MTYICLVKLNKENIMSTENTLKPVIEITDLGDTLHSSGTTFHHGVVTIGGNPYDFSICEMYDDNSDSTSFEVSILECDEKDKIDDQLILEELSDVQEIHNMGEEELLEMVLSLRSEMKQLNQAIKSGLPPHEENETYLCESKDFVYFRDEAYQSVVMYRKSDNKKWSIDDVVSGELLTDVHEGNIIKLSPEFIYDYNEILKEKEGNS